MTIKLKVPAESTLLMSGEWVSNGHWLIRRRLFRDGICKLPPYYQGVLDSGVLFAKRGQDGGRFGEIANVPDFSKLLSGLEQWAQASVKDLTVNRCTAVDVPKKNVMAWINSEYADLLTTEFTWYVNEELNQFHGVDLVDVQIVVMGMQLDDSEGMDPSEQLVIDIAAKIKERKKEEDDERQTETD